MNKRTALSAVLALTAITHGAQAQVDFSAYYQMAGNDTVRTVNPDKKMGFTQFWALSTSLLSPLIPYQYDWVEDFYEGHAVVQVNGKYGIIDQNGKMLVPAQYDHIVNYNKGYALVTDKGKYGLINREGSVVVPIEYDFINPLLSKKSTTTAVKNGKWGLITTANKTLVPFDYAYCKMEEDGTFLGLDANLKIYNFSAAGTPFKYPGARTFKELAPGVYEVKMADGTNGIINEKMEVLLAPEKQVFNQVSPKKPIVIVRKARLYGLYNYVQKSWVLPVASAGIYANNSGSIVKVIEKRPADGEEGIVRFYDANGKQLFGKTFQDGESFDMDILGGAILKYNGKWGVIDESGKELIPFEVWNKNDISYDSKDAEVIIARREDGFGVVDRKSGKVIFPFAFTDKLKGNPFGFWESSKYFVLNKDEQIALYAKNGQVVFPFGKYNDLKVEHSEPIRGTKSTYVFMQNKNEKWAAMDLDTKKQVTPFDYESIGQLRSNKSDNAYLYYLYNINKPGYKSGVYMLKEGRLFNAKDFEYGDYHPDTEVFEISDGCGMLCSKYGLADKNGNPITEIVYNELMDQEDCFYVQKGNKVGYLDRTGKEIIPVTYDVRYNENKQPQLDFMYNGFASLMKGKKTVLVAKGGKVVNTSILKAASDATYQYANFGKIKVLAAYTPDLLKFAINKNVYEAGASLDVMAQPAYRKKYDFAKFVFYQGLLAAKKDGRFGFLDYNGNEVIPFEYDAASDFTPYGYAYVQKGDDYFLLDRYGNKMPMMDIQIGALKEASQKKK